MQVNETSRLEMPLVMPAQAQKHVTVNEALMRLDAAVNLVLRSDRVTAPPERAGNGDCWAVPVGAQGAWTGQAGKIAVSANGGWIFMPARAGMRAFILDRGVEAAHDGFGWVAGVLTLSGSGSGLIAGMVEEEIIVGTGAQFETPVTIPAGVMVIGAVARVIEPLGGSVISWRLGVNEAGGEDRFGKGLGTGKGSWSRGMLGSATTVFKPQKLVMEAEDGAFDGGRVVLAVHWLELRLPRQEVS